MNQSYDNIQYIIVDDGSTHFERSAVEQHIAKHNLGNVKAEVIVNQQNQGIIRSSNIALSRAKGKYILNLAGDDCFADEHVVADVVAEFERTNAMVLTGYRRICDYAMNETDVLQPSSQYVKWIRHLDSQELFERMAAYNFILGCCTAYAKKCFDLYGLHDEQYRNLDDYTLHMKLLRHGVQIQFFDRVFVKYRSGGVSSLSGISAGYIAEADRIFEQEIKPYSVKPLKADKRYSQWKKRMEINRGMAQQIEKYQGNKLLLLILKIGCYVKQPGVLISAIKEKLL